MIKTAEEAGLGIDREIRGEADPETAGAVAPRTRGGAGRGKGGTGIGRIATGVEVVVVVVVVEVVEEASRTSGEGEVVETGEPPNTYMFSTFSSDRLPTCFCSFRGRRERTPPEERLAREKEKELKEMDRATRTVFACNLNLKADERDIFKFFSQAGTVNDIQVSWVHASLLSSF